MLNNINMRFLWKEDKNDLLKQHRGISFEQVVLSIESKQIVDVIEHPNQEKYKGQIFILVERNDMFTLFPYTSQIQGKNVT